MLDLSPAKLLIIVVVVVVLLGPDKLPQVARQVGSAWRRLKDFHAHVEQEVRESLPDLPSSQEIARMARSPVALLNQLAEMPATSENDHLVADPAAPNQATHNGAVHAEATQNGGTQDESLFPEDPGSENASGNGELNGSRAAPSTGVTPVGRQSTGTPDVRPAPLEGAQAPLSVPDDPSMN